MQKKVRDLFLIVLLSLIPTLLIWLPFYLRLKSFWTIPLPQEGMATIVSNYDGPLYLVVAKTLYNPQLISESFSFNLPTEYYAAHFPLYPLLIRLFSYLTGYPYAMLLITLLSSILCLYFFYLFIQRNVEEKKDALWLTAIFAVFPARWLIVRSVGSPEPLFLASVIASIYFFQKRKYWLAGIWGAVAQLTKSPGILLFLAYGLAILLPRLKNLTSAKFSTWFQKLPYQKILPLLLIPLALLAVFGLYGLQLNDFWAYFHSGDNIHLFLPPFQIFNYSAPWVGTFWLEEIIFVYLFISLGLLRLIKKEEYVLASFVGLFLITILFVAHRDLIRYSLPVVPFLLAAFSDTLIKKEFKIILAILIIPIFLFSLAFISQNTMLISNWSPLL